MARGRNGRHLHVTYDQFILSLHGRWPAHLISHFLSPHAGDASHPLGEAGHLLLTSHLSIRYELRQAGGLSHAGQWQGMEGPRGSHRHHKKEKPGIIPNPGMYHSRDVS